MILLVSTLLHHFLVDAKNVFCDNFLSLASIKVDAKSHFSCSVEYCTSLCNKKKILKLERIKMDRLRLLLVSYTHIGFDFEIPSSPS